MSSRSRTDLRLPKFAVGVEVAFVSGGRSHVDVFLAAQSDHAFRREHVLDLLQSNDAFVPVHDRDSGGWSLLNKATIGWVSFALTDGALPVEEEAENFETQIFDTKVNVRVEFAQLDPLEGHLLYTPPAEKPRLVDHLNQPGRFVRLWTEDHVYLVSKQHAIRFVEVSESEQTDSRGESDGED